MASTDFPIQIFQSAGGGLFKVICAAFRGKGSTWEYYGVAYAEIVLIVLKVELLTCILWLFTQWAFALNLQCSKETRVNKGQKFHTWLVTLIIFHFNHSVELAKRLEIISKNASWTPADFCANGRETEN